jgi:hypothetical protein
MPKPLIRRNVALDNMQQGSHGRSGEVISYSMYDTFSTVSTTLKYKFFSVPQGPTKTEADTNNLLAGYMPSGQRLTASTLKIMIVGIASMTAALQQNLFNMLFDTTIAVKMPGKDNLGIWTLAEIMGNGLLLSNVATQYGPVPTFSGRYRLGVPLIFAAQTAFDLTLTHHVAPAAGIDGTRIKFSLSGTLERLS